MRRSSPLKLFLLVAEVENSSVAYSFAFSSGRNLRPGGCDTSVAFSSGRNSRPGDEFVLPGGLRRADLLSALGVLFKTSRVKLL
jgi:hypothetical protein